MFNLGLESFHQADIVIKMEVPPQLRHIIKGRVDRGPGSTLIPFWKVSLHALPSRTEGSLDLPAISRSA